MDVQFCQNHTGSILADTTNLQKSGSLGKNCQPKTFLSEKYLLRLQSSDCIGNELIHCRCTSGIFNLSIDSRILLGSTICSRCGHTLSQHDDFAPEEDRSAGKLLSTLIYTVGNLLTHHSELPKALHSSDLGSLICRREGTVAELYNVAGSFTQEVHQLVERLPWESCYRTSYRE